MKSRTPSNRSLECHPTFSVIGAPAGMVCGSGPPKQLLNVVTGNKNRVPATVQQTHQACRMYFFLAAIPPAGGSTSIVLGMRGQVLMENMAVMAGGSRHSPVKVPGSAVLLAPGV